MEARNKQREKARNLMNNRKWIWMMRAMVVACVREQHWILVRDVLWKRCTNSRVNDTFIAFFFLSFFQYLKRCIALTFEQTLHTPTLSKRYRCCCCYWCMHFIWFPRVVGLTKRKQKAKQNHISHMLVYVFIYFMTSTDQLSWVCINSI